MGVGDDLHAGYLIAKLLFPIFPNVSPEKKPVSYIPDLLQSEENWKYKTIRNILLCTESIYK